MPVVLWIAIRDSAHRDGIVRVVVRLRALAPSWHPLLHPVQRSELMAPARSRHWRRKSGSHGIRRACRRARPTTITPPVVQPKAAAEQKSGACWHEDQSQREEGNDDQELHQDEENVTASTRAKAAQPSPGQEGRQGAGRVEPTPP